MSCFGHVYLCIHARFAVRRKLFVLLMYTKRIHDLSYAAPYKGCTVYPLR